MRVAGGVPVRQRALAPRERAQRVEARRERPAARPADAGVDGIFLTGAQAREEIEAIHKATPLPLLLGSTPPALSDRGFLAANGVRIALQGHVPFQVVVKALHDAYKHLKDGGSPAGLKDRAASEELMNQALNRAAYRRWQHDYLGEP